MLRIHICLLIALAFFVEAILSVPIGAEEMGYGVAKVMKRSPGGGDPLSGLVGTVGGLLGPVVDTVGGVVGPLVGDVGGLLGL